VRKVAGPASERTDGSMNKSESPIAAEGLASGRRLKRGLRARGACLDAAPGPKTVAFGYRCAIVGSLQIRTV
jgi:hypothetical protein